jgi:hypothetical protein
MTELELGDRPAQKELWERMRAALKIIAARDGAWCHRWLHGAVLGLEAVARDHQRPKKTLYADRAGYPPARTRMRK